MLYFKTLGVIRESKPICGLREEPHFESMIFSDLGRRSIRRTVFSLDDPEAAVEINDGQSAINGEEIDLQDLYEGLDPVRHIF
jgi:hypothetical protein